MRVLRSLFLFTIICLVLGGVTLIATREVLLYTATNQLKSSIVRMEAAKASGSYYRECLKSGSSTTEPIIQLRFISNTEYVLEALCTAYSTQPLPIESDKLPPLVEKLPGKSGLILDLEMSSVELACLGRRSGVLLEGERVSTNLSEFNDSTMRIGPPTTCEGYGYVCCQTDFQAGDGAPIAGASNCPNTCHSSCQERPLVLSFNTNPFFDPPTRILQVPRDQSVTFSFMVSENQRDAFAKGASENPTNLSGIILTIAEKFYALTQANDKKTANIAVKPTAPLVTIDYGDGEVGVSDLLQGSLDHVYKCNLASCNYSAKITARNLEGVESAQTILSKVDVVVN